MFLPPKSLSALPRNAETLVSIRNAALAEQYTANWQKHLQHSEPYGVSTTATTSSAQRSATADEPLQPTKYFLVDKTSSSRR